MNKLKKMYLHIKYYPLSLNSLAFYSLMFFLLLIMIFPPVNGAPSEQWLNDECDFYNYSFQECSDFRDSFEQNITFEDTISNETQLIEDTKEELKDDYKERIEDLETKFSGDIQSVNDTLNNMDFSIYNDSALITNLEEETNQRFDSIQNQLNEFTGNTTTFNLNDIIQTQTQLYVAKETQKQIKSIFEDEEENKDEVNLSNYVTFSDLNSRLNSIQSTSTENTNAANKNMMYFGFLLIIGGAVAFYYKIFQPMQRKLNNLQRNNSVSLPQEPILPTQQNKEGEKNDNPFSNKN